MATRTFVADGTSRAWSLTTTWAEGSVPTAVDDVVFSTNVASSILVVDGTSGSPSLCRSMDTTNYTRTITFATGKQLNVGDPAGSGTGVFKMTAGMTFVPAGTALVKFVSTVTGNNITWGGYTFINVTFDGVSGGWTFQDALALSASTLALTNGALNLNSKNVSNALFSSSNSNTRSLTMGTMTWSLAASANSWDITIPTGMTLSAASSTISGSLLSSASYTFAGGGLTYGTLSSTTMTSGNLNLTGTNTFGTLTLNIAASGTGVASGYKFSADQTVTGTFTSAGGSLAIRNFLYSDTMGTARTISAGTFAITNTDLRDITKAGAGSGNISATSSTTGNGDCGGNSGWTFQAPRNVFMKTAVSVNWSAANWFTTSGGSTAAVPPIPLCHDTHAVFDINSVTAGSKTITLDMPRIAGFTWSGVANTPAFATGSTEFEVVGDVILVSGMTHTGTGQADLVGRGSFSLDGGTLTWPASSTININASGGTYTLARAFTSSAGLISTNGTFALGGFAPTVTTISNTGGTISGTGAITGTTYNQNGGTTTLGGTLTLSSTASISAGTFDMNSNSVTGGTSLAVSGSGTLDLSGQWTASTTITVSGGTVANTGVSGELKTTGNSAITFSGGTSSPKKITSTNASGPNIIVSSSGTLSMPASSSINWTGVGIFEVSGATAIFTTAGPITGTANTLIIGAASSGGGSFTFGS